MKKQPSVLVTDCNSLYGAIHKEGADPSSTDKRLAIKLAVVKSRTTASDQSGAAADQRKRCWKHDGKREREAKKVRKPLTTEDAEATLG